MIKLTVIKPVSGITSIITPSKQLVSHNFFLFFLVGIPFPHMIILTGSSSIASIPILAQKSPAPTPPSCRRGIEH